MHHLNIPRASQPFKSPSPTRVFTPFISALRKVLLSTPPPIPAFYANSTVEPTILVVTLQHITIVKSMFRMKKLFSLALLLGIAASEPHTTGCGPPYIEPSLALQFTPSMPIQTAPTSTVYSIIVTSYLNVVDCNYIRVENIEDNTAPVGPFTALTTVPYLVVYRVGCMRETTVVTRRDYPIHDMTQPVPTSTGLPESSPEIVMHNKRDTMEASLKKQVFGIAERLASGIDPTNENITVREFNYLEQINTALFALNLVNLAFDLDQMCEYLLNATVAQHLEDSLINPSQASNIVCFAAEFGLYFGMSNDELLADLAALEYAIQLHAYTTKTLQELCEGLDYTAASFLGIDTDGIRSYICNGTAGISSSISFLSTSTAVATGTGSGGSGTAPLSSMGPTGTVSIIYGSNGPTLSSATSAAGTVAPWFNTTVTETVDVMTMTVNAGTASPESITPVPRPLFSPPQLRQARYRF